MAACVFSLFTAEGAFLETWPILSSYGSNRPFYLLPDGQALNPSRPGKLVRYGSDGPTADSDPLSQPGTSIPTTLRSRTNTPRALFSPPVLSRRRQWTMTRDGQFLFGITGSLPDRPLGI